LSHSISITKYKSFVTDGTKVGNYPGNTQSAA